MQRAVKATPVFLAQEEADAATLRRLGARVQCVGDTVGSIGNDVILIARGGGRDLLIGMNLGGEGRFLDLGANGSVEATVQGHTDPLGLLDEMAHDIFWHEERPLSAWAMPDQPKAQPCGFDFLEPHLRWVPPELDIVAGPYGCGKSTFNRLLAYRWADTIGRKQNARVSIVGWEDKIHTIKREVLRYSLGGDVASLTSAQAARLADMEGRIGWTQRHPDDARLLSWYCDLVEHRAKRDGVRFFVFDPFNEHDSTRAPNQTETEYVREMMIKFRKLVHSLGIIMIVVTHVSAKSYDETGKIKPFRIANASGSVQFGNKADRGICIVRTASLRDSSSLGADEHMVLHFDKAKDEEVMGRRGTVACIFDPKAMTLTEDAGATAAARRSWS
jgi:AAA domain